MKDKKSLFILLAGVLLLLASVLAYIQPWQNWPDQETKAWQLTVVGSDGSKKVLSFQDIRELPAHKGSGGFFSTVGIVFGPYQTKGVTLVELCNTVGGIKPGEALMVSARDGYSTVLSYEQVKGDFITYSTDLKEVPHQELTTILMYQQDGRLLSDADGKPLRIAIVGSPPNLLTEGNYWVKWVNELEVLRAP